MRNRWPALLLPGLLGLSWLLAAGLFYWHKDQVRLLKLPPDSLAEWYKPANERQVWLHTMFNLRREMQAVREYGLEGSDEQSADWANKLAGHYLKLGDMVPEWRGFLKPQIMDEITRLIEKQQFSALPNALEALQRTCDNCHQQYRTVTALLYRSPNFDGLEINENESLDSSMQRLGEQVNRIRLAYLRADTTKADAELVELSAGMKQLGSLCEQCHTKDTPPYPDDDILATISTLHQALQGTDVKTQGRALGTLAVKACAECHGTHRIAYDMAEQLKDTPDWQQLLRHD